MSPNRLVDFLPDKILFKPQFAMSKVMAKDGRRIYASSDHMFRGAVFARDSLEVAEDLLDIKPQLVENILLSMGELQGTTTNRIREEEEGKIIHEYRSLMIDGKKIDKSSLRIFRELAGLWGGTEQEMAYYGSIDATPLFLRILGKFCSLHGIDILNKTVVQRNGVRLTMYEVAQKSAQWLMMKLAASKSGLLEWQRTNPHGSLSQAWKDSEEFYVHENGKFANHEAPLSSIEVQGQTYDALQMAASLFKADSAEYTARARQLQADTINLLWQPDRGYFALGTDYDSRGNLRIIQTKSANAAGLLDTSIFDNLPDKQRQNYITGIVKTIMSHDFLTDAGIRSRALSKRSLVKIWDYHGSYVTWPKETHDIAKGLRHQGFARLARQLENRLLNAVLRTYDYPEFVYVDAHGRVLTGAPKKTKRKHGELIDIGGVDKPERLQAWTVSAVWSIVDHRRSRKHEHTQQNWEAVLEANILGQIPHMDRLTNPIRLLRYYPNYPYFVPNLKNKYKTV